MRVCVHDHCGHPYPVRLSRALAARGHDVLHLTCPSVAAPRGPLAPRETDPATLTLAQVPAPGALAKYRPVRRAVQEAVFARRAGTRIAAFAPDVVLSGNCSPLVQRLLQRRVHALGAAFVYWLQDLHAPAVRRAVPGRVARAAAGPVARLEGSALRRGEAVVAIADAFRDAVIAHGVPEARVHVVPNWAPVPELTPEPDAGQAWRMRHGHGRRFLYVYAGTLGLKHEPGHLLALARAHRDDPDTAILALVQGPGREVLLHHREREGLGNLTVLPPQPIDELARVLAAADAGLATLTEAAGGFSVPSKILSYLAAGLPVLAAVPASNAAAELLTATGAGTVVPPDDLGAWCAAAESLRTDPDSRARMSAAGRAHAERAFSMTAVGPRFERVFEAALTAPSTARSAAG